MSHAKTHEESIKLVHEGWPARGMGRIQWNGTNVCIDVLCACGASGHIDGDFVYYVRCKACKRTFALNPQVRMVEVAFEPDACCWDFGGDEEDERARLAERKASASTEEGIRPAERPIGIVAVDRENRAVTVGDLDAHMAALAAQAAEDFEADYWISWALFVYWYQRDEPLDASELRSLFADEPRILRRLDERGVV
jgi:hypothetical protein